MTRENKTIFGWISLLLVAAGLVASLEACRHTELLGIENRLSRIEANLEWVIKALKDCQNGLNYP